jgi:hypothetical protein
MDDKVQGKVQGIDENALNQNQEILDRLKRAAGVSTDAALAKILGLKPQNVTQAKRRGVPNPWIVQISKQFNCDINKLLNLRQEYTCGLDVHRATIGEDQGKYGKPDLGQAVNLLADIMNSGDTSIIQALHSNLVAFRDAVMMTGNQVQLERENAELKEEVKRLRRRIERSAIDRLEQRMERIERLYHEQMKHSGKHERRGIMAELGSILGYQETSDDGNSR